MGMKQKICSRCGELKVLAEFKIQPRSMCRPCRLQYNKERYRLNREKRLLQAKENYWRRKDEILAFLKTPEGREYGRMQKKKQYERNGAKLRTRVKQWRLSNPDYHRGYQSTPEMRLHSNVSRAIRSSLKLNKAGRGWESLVGYTLKDLITHIEMNFSPGMTWQNYGKWELDHKIPKALFKFERADDQAFKNCWALSNLQPLWMSDNRKKYMRVEGGKAA
jgi:hypothetical protein